MLDQRGAIFNQRLLDLDERQRQANEDRSRLAAETERLKAEIEAFEEDKNRQDYTLIRSVIICPL